MKFARLGETVLHYEESGHPSNPPLVFINSLGTDLRIWDEVIPQLVNAFHVICYDKRGHGLSDVTPAPHRIRTHTDDLIGLLDALHLDRINLVGISVGGLIAMDVALTHPTRVSALVLCDTAPKIGTSEMWSQRIEAIRAQGLAPLGNAILARWFSSEFISHNPTVYRGYFNMLTRMPADGYVAACEVLREADLRNELGRLAVRTLAVCGSQDVSTPPDVMQDWANRLPNAQFEVIEGAGHLPCLERPTELAVLINQFLNEEQR